MLAVIAFVVALGFGVVAPAIPLFADGFGVGKTAIGLAVSAFAFFRFVSAFGSGSLVDRVGERVVLASGLAIVALTSAAAGLAPNFVAFVALRATGGLGSAMFTVAAMSLLLRVAPSHSRGRATSRFQSGFLLGGITGPAVGGFLTQVSPALPFFVYAGFLVVAGGIAMIWLHESAVVGPQNQTHRDDAGVRACAKHGEEGAGLSDGGCARGEPASAEPRTSVRAALGHRAYLAALVANLGVGWMLFGVRNSLVPLYVVEALGRTAAWAGAGFLVGSVAQALLLIHAGRFSDGAGRRPAMLLGAGICCLSVAALVLDPNLVVFLISMTSLGAGMAFLASAPSAVVGDLSAGQGGRLVGVFQMASDFGAVTGPLAAGFLAERFSYQAAFAVSAGVLGLAVVAALLMPETRTRRPVPVTALTSPTSSASPVSPASPA